MVWCISGSILTLVSVVGGLGSGVGEYSSLPLPEHTVFILDGLTEGIRGCIQTIEMMRSFHFRSAHSPTPTHLAHFTIADGFTERERTTNTETPRDS